MMKKQIDRQFLILFGFIILLLVGLSLMTQRLINTTNDISSTNKQIRNENLKRDKYEDLLAQYKQIVAETKYQEVNDLLPNADEFIRVIEDLEENASLSNNQIIIRLGDTRLTTDGFEIDLNKVKNQSTSQYDSINIEATIRGNFTSLKQFLHLMEESRYFMNIKTMKISRFNISNRVVLDTFMNIQVYVEKVIIK